MTDQLSPSDDRTFQPKPAEWMAVAALLSAMLAVNLWTYNLYPTVWSDEVLWSEPAINLVKTGHFTTSVWQLQPADTFWAAQSPLYCFLLAGWLPLAGDSLLAVRSFNYVLMTVAAGLVWFGSWRWRIVARPALRVMIVPLLLLGYGLSYAYRCSRPDILGLICLTCLGLACLVQAAERRRVLLFLLAASAPWVGVQVALYVLVACVAAKLVFRDLTVRDLAVVGIGLCAGAISLLVLFAANGVLPYFLDTLHQAADEPRHFGNATGYAGTISRRLSSTLGSYLGDFSALPLGFALAGFWFCSRNWDQRYKRGAGFLLLLFFGVPLVFNFTGHFAFYYSYMIYVPLVLAFLMAYESLAGGANRMLRALAGGAFFLAVLGAMLLGLPMRLLLSASFCEIVPREKYTPIIQSQIKREDVVLSHFAAFFEAKQVARKVYSPMYARRFINLSVRAHDFSPEERKQMTVLIMWPEQMESLREYFGGKWVAVSEPFGDSCSLPAPTWFPLLARRLQSHFASPQVSRQKLQIFRRVNDEAGGGSGEESVLPPIRTTE